MLISLEDKPGKCTVTIDGHKYIVSRERYSKILMAIAINLVPADELLKKLETDCCCEGGKD